MEGDGPTGSMVIYEYVRLLGFLEKNKAESLQTQNMLLDMFDPMIKITQKYLNLALDCEPIILATILHPSWRLKLFEGKLPDHAAKSNNIFLRAFADREKKLKADQPQPVMEEIKAAEAEEDDGFDFFPVQGKKADENDELQRYIINGQYPISKKSELLAWWKVCTLDSISSFQVN
jgi:hypothetical protein